MEEDRDILYEVFFQSGPVEINRKFYTSNSRGEAIIKYKKREPAPNAPGHWQANEVKVDGYEILLESIVEVPINYGEIRANVRREGDLGSIHIVTRIENSLDIEPSIRTYKDLIDAIKLDTSGEPYLDRRGIGKRSMEVILAHLEWKGKNYKNKVWKKKVK